MKKCNELMSRSLVCCLPNDAVAKLAQLMKSKDIGAIPVIDAQATRRPIGIVTDRDLALGVVAMGRDPLTTHAEEVMTRAVVTCQEDEDVLEALEAMSVYQLRRIPVVDYDNRLVGIISQADLATRLDQPKRMAEMLKEVSIANTLVMER